jgi:hypothetical protein
LKLSHSVDLQSIRDRVSRALDVHHATRAPNYDPAAGLRAFKLIEARSIIANTSDGTMIAAEAKAKKMTVRELAQLVIDKNLEMMTLGLEVEAERQARKLHIAAATSEQELIAIEASLGVLFQ